MDLVQENIRNLCRLWQLLGTKQETDSSPFHQSISWPNRAWLDVEDASLPSVEFIKNIAPKSTVPVWGQLESHHAFKASLIKLDFTLAFEQTAMYLELSNHRTNAECPLQLQKLEAAADIQAWTTLASEAFGYTIDNQVIDKIARHPNIQLLAALSGETMVATALLHKTGSIAGIHQVGVPTRFAGKGYATQVMQAVLSRCAQWQCDIVTLQASSAGKGIYQKLGFTEQFAIRNYQK